MNLKFWNAWEIVRESRQFQVLAGASIMTLLGFVASSEVANSQSAIIDLNFDDGSHGDNSDCVSLPTHTMLPLDTSLSSCESRLRLGNFFLMFRWRFTMVEKTKPWRYLSLDI
jgi:hypothetical protein